MPASSTSASSRDGETARLDPPKPSSTAAYLEHLYVLFLTIHMLELDESLVDIG